MMSKGLSKGFAVLMSLVAVLAFGAVIVSANEQETDSTITRIDTNRAALANVFQDEDGFNVWRWNTETERGEYQFAVTYEEIEAAQVEAEAGEEAVLLAQNGDVTFYILDNGQCQISSPTVDGYQYSYAWDCYTAEEE